MRGQSKADATKGKGEVHQLETIDTEVPSSGSESHHLYAILQLGNKADKFLVFTKINGVDVEMELDSGADRSTVPWTWYQEKLAGVCKLVPTDVTLYQYDTSPLMIKGQCKVTVQVLDQKICATLMVVDVKNQIPLFGRDWMVSFGLNLPTILNHTLQVSHVTSTGAKKAG